jgi:predicted transcriptional regulator
MPPKVNKPFYTGLTEAERAMLNALAEAHHTTPTNVVRRALRLFLDMEQVQTEGSESLFKDRYKGPENRF